LHRGFPATNQRTLLVLLIGEHLASELPQLYRAINETLIDADILPRLKRSYSDSAPANAGAAAADAARMVSTLERLTKARMPAGGTGSAPGGDAGGREFLNTLLTLQKAPAPVAAGAPPTNVVRLARESAAARHVAPAEAVALDIVSALFDLIFKDDNVSDGIKLLVGRLQMPVLKVAMLNQQFSLIAAIRHGVFEQHFRNRDSLGKYVDASDPFIASCRNSSNDPEYFRRDIRRFRCRNTELGDFIAERDVIEAESQSHLAEAVRARGTNSDAARGASSRTADCRPVSGTAAEATVPKSIEHFLRSYWRDVLQSRISRTGPTAIRSSRLCKLRPNSSGVSRRKKRPRTGRNR
jgi:hypothetical protein